MRKPFLVLGLMLACCLLAASSGEAKPPKGRKFPDILIWMEKAHTFYTRARDLVKDFKEVERWVKEALAGKKPTTSLRCHQPDETIRTLTRNIQGLKVPELPNRRDSRYRSAVTKDSPRQLWLKDLDKLTAFNLDLREQLKVMKEVEVELDRVIREAKQIHKAAEVVSSSHKRLEARIQAAKQIEAMMKESFGCAWKDLERGLVVNLKELITQAERKKRDFVSARTQQERVLKEHTGFLLSGSRKYDLSLPSEIR
jgi:hypothetical protein